MLKSFPYVYFAVYFVPLIPKKEAEEVIRIITSSLNSRKEFSDEMSGRDPEFILETSGSSLEHLEQGMIVL
ncbi:hypothetical protein JTE90_025422 [Oedothorax gibbosus]|uniref:Uncharacterized protein n=1 Tax=Oedothorax gibbosus TaxID=931172 RepID=A0AAV6U730_9ARAC|nr:hypothetical protein JTE90_025422 [Oedothorax gibbosus]